MRWTGLKKWKPQNRSGRWIPSASVLTDSDEGFVAITVSGARRHRGIRHDRRLLRRFGQEEDAHEVLAYRPDDQLGNLLRLEFQTLANRASVAVLEHAQRGERRGIVAARARFRHRACLRERE